MRDYLFRLRRPHPRGRISATSALRAEDTVGDEDLLECAYANLQKVYHPISTCRMGSGETAVVSPRLQVNGIDAPWIADASVIPTVPRGHPTAVVAMIANRAADFVLDDG